MKSFRQYLLEQNTESPAPYDVSQDLQSIEDHTTDNGIRVTTHHYVSKKYGVSRKIHVWTTPEGTIQAYTGWGNIDENGNIEDSSNPQTNIPKGLKVAKSDMAFRYLADFARKHPHIEEILYQTEDTEAGKRSQIRTETYWPHYQKKHNIDTRLVRVSDTWKNPLK